MLLTQMRSIHVWNLLHTSYSSLAPRSRPRSPPPSSPRRRCAASTGATGGYTAIAKAARKRGGTSGHGNSSAPAPLVAFNPNCAHAKTEHCSPFCTAYGHTAEQCADCASPRCAGMSEEKIADEDKFCRVAKASRESTCKADCSSASADPAKQEQCTFGCGFWAQRP